jgi:hypothetical protein
VAGELERVEENSEGSPILKLGPALHRAPSPSSRGQLTLKRLSPVKNFFLVFFG